MSQKRTETRQKRQRGECHQIFIPEIKEAKFIAKLREERIIGKISRESVTDVAFQGPSLPDGSVNFDCTCTGNLPFGPCGKIYRSGNW